MDEVYLFKEVASMNKHKVDVASGAKRIHIVGASPRSGTTLMMQLMVNGFEIDQFCDHEMSIFDHPAERYTLFCSKKPSDIISTKTLLAIDHHLWVLCMVRDPRDVIVSKHAKYPEMYWTNLGKWKMHIQIAERMSEHHRFVIMQYEHLVADPNGAQCQLMDNMPFLKKRGVFSEFHWFAKPCHRAIRALGGVRPINTSSIGSWRLNKPRVAAQLRLHGSVRDDLIRWGYERDDGWLKELDGIEPKNGKSYIPDRSPPMAALGSNIQRYFNIGLYSLGAISGWMNASQRQGDGPQL